MEGDPMLANVDQTIWLWCQATDITKASQSKQFKRHAADFDILLGIVERHAFALLTGTFKCDSVCPGEKEIHAIVSAIWRNKHLHSPSWTHGCLVRCLQRLKDATGANLPIPHFAIPLPHPRPWVTLDDMSYLPALRKHEPRFIESLKNLDPRTFSQGAGILSNTHDLNKSQLLLGQALFSAARYGGLTIPDLLGGLLACVQDLRSNSVWAGDSLTLDIPAVAQNRLWCPDPLTTVLILRLVSLGVHAEHGTSTDMAVNCVSTFLASLRSNDEHSLTVPDFLRACKTARALEQPSFICAWENGRTASPAWSLATERRVRLGRRFRRPKTETHNKNTAIPVTINVNMKPPAQPVSKVDSLHPYRTLYDCIPTRSHNWRAILRRNITAWQGRNQGQLGFIPTAVSAWIMSMAGKNTPGHLKVGSPHSVSTYLSRIGRELFAVASGLDSIAHDYEEFWIDVYNDVIGAKKGHNNRQQAAIECQNFHDFLYKAGYTPPIDFLAENGITRARQTGAVNANYITPFEFESAYKLLARKRHDIFHAEALNLFYWSDLRISELAGLRFKDIQGLSKSGNSQRNPFVEIIVRPHYKRGVKRPASRRRIPLHAVMPAEYLDKFIKFYERRFNAVSFLTGREVKNQYLFAYDDAAIEMPDVARIREAIQPVLRIITGDPSIVIHHIRHSTTNNLIMMLSAETSSDPIWSLFHKPPKLLIELASVLKQRLGLSSTARRHILWVVSTLLGHTDPTTTLASYVHVLPWLAECGAQRHIKHTRYPGLKRSITLDAILTLKSNQAARVWRQNARKKQRANISSLASWWGRQLKLGAPHREGQNVERLPARWPQVPKQPMRIPNAKDLFVICEQGMRGDVAHRVIASAVHLELSLVEAVLAAHFRIAPRLGRSPGNISPDVPIGNASKGSRNTMPRPPRQHQDIEDLEYFWTRLISDREVQRLIRSRFATDGTSKPRMTPAWLKVGCAAFKDSHTGKSRQGRFGARHLNDALSYVRLVRRFYPHSSIVVKAHLCQGVSPKEALANLKSRFGTNLTFVVERAIVRRAMAGWNMGTIAIALSTSRIIADNNNQVSYGAWYAMYCCTLLAESFNNINRVI
jgi:integrase